MSTPTLLDEFQNSTSDELLKVLLEVYKGSLPQFEEDQIARMAQKLRLVFKERSDATPAS